MARRKPSPSSLSTDLQALSQRVPEDLFLASLRDQPAHVQGYAYRFFLVLPVLSAEGKRVFTDEHLSHLFSLFNTRFGGCLASSSRSGAPFFGEYLPEGPSRSGTTIPSFSSTPAPSKPVIASFSC